MQIPGVHARVGRGGVVMAKIDSRIRVTKFARGMLYGYPIRQNDIICLLVSLIKGMLFSVKTLEGCILAYFRGPFEEK